MIVNRQLDVRYRTVEPLVRFTFHRLTRTIRPTRSKGVHIFSPESSKWLSARSRQRSGGLSLPGTRQPIGVVHGHAKFWFTTRESPAIFTGDDLPRIRRLEIGLEPYSRVASPRGYNFGASNFAFSGRLTPPPTTAP